MNLNKEYQENGHPPGKLGKFENFTLVREKSE